MPPPGLPVADDAHLPPALDVAGVRMDKLKIAFLYHGEPPEELAMMPADVDCLPVVCPPSREYTDAQLRQIAGCDALLPHGTYVPAPVLDAAKRARICQAAGSGYEKIDVAAATRNGILVCNNAGTNSHRVADFTLLAILALMRNFVNTVIAFDGGRDWEGGRVQGRDSVQVTGKVLGIVGFGHIGQAVARRARAFDMPVIYHDTHAGGREAEAAALGARAVTLDELCREADVISVHAPLNARSRRMISDSRFALMKEGAYIVCNGRGDVIDEAALRRALESGKVAGAAMDVFSIEPILPDNPLIGAPRLLLTPHMAGRGRDGLERSLEAAMNNIRGFLLEGRLPENLINPEARPDLFR
jgi:phosphoglycerate dehydrogenase-like enzyme